MGETKVTMKRIAAETIGQGIALLSDPMPGYHTATVMIRLEGGMASEPEEQLGLAYVIEQALDKGTAGRSAKEFADAFDALGANQAIYTGRQSWVIVLSSLPEYLPGVIELCGEMFCTPTFPDEAVTTAVSLSEQELFSLDDSPRSILRRQMMRQAYGPLLGRHMLGEKETLAAITPAAAREHWRRCCAQSKISCALAGKYDDGAVRAALMRAFASLPAEGPATAPNVRAFSPLTTHLDKELEQTQIGISFPGLAYDDPAFAVEKVMLGVLSGGMSSRLFTEVREKLGLVYWVAAWHEQPRGLGMVHVGAATKPERAQTTHDTLLAEIARLERDLDEEELQRAKIGLIADNVTSGASVQQRASDLLVDYYQLGYGEPAEVKTEAVRTVTVDDIRAYLRSNPRDALSVVSVGKHAVAKA